MVGRLFYSVDAIMLGLGLRLRLGGSMNFAWNFQGLMHRLDDVAGIVISWPCIKFVYLFIFEVGPVPFRLLSVSHSIAAARACPSIIFAC